VLRTVFFCFLCILATLLVHDKVGSEEKERKLTLDRIKGSAGGGSTIEKGVADRPGAPAAAPAGVCMADCWLLDGGS